MKGRGIFSVGAIIAWTYAAVVCWSDYQHNLDFPPEQRVVISQPGPVTFGSTDISVIEEPFLSADDFLQGTVTLHIGTEYFTSADEVWIDTRADPDNYRVRYLERFDMGYLVNGAHQRLYIVETLQGEFALADEPRLNLWSVDELGHIESTAAIPLAQALQDPAWSVVFAGTHAAEPRTVPAIAAVILGAGFMLLASRRFWRAGGWGVACALMHFLVPIIGGAPLLADPGRRYLMPAILVAFVLTAYTGAALASWWRARTLRGLTTRVIGAVVVPVATLLVGVAAAVSLAMVSALLIDDLEPARLLESFATTALQPTVLLLRTGAGVALILALAGAMYDIFMARKIRQAAIASA